MNKLFTKIVGVALGLTMAVGAGVAVSANNGEVVPVHAAVSTRYTLNTATTKIATNAAYNSYTDSTNGWAVTLGSMQSAGLWLGSNSSQKAKMRLDSNGAAGGSISGYAAIASAIGVQSSATYYAAIIQTANSISNVDTVNLTYTTPGGTAPSEAWILYSTNSGSSWSVFQKVTSLSASGTTFTHSNVASARYAFVIHSTNYCQFKVPVLTFKGTDASTQTISGSTSGTAGTGVVLTTNATSSTQWTITANTCGASLSANTGTSVTVNATSAGSVTVQATCGSEWTTATHTIEFAAADAESITVTGSSSLYVGDSDITLTATPENFSPATYTWNSSNTGVATISGSGATATLHAVSKGTTVITASASGTGGTVTSNEFTVTIKRFSIALSSSEVSMKASKSTTVTVTPTDANGTVVVSAVSNDTSVATVSVSGTTITINSGSAGGVSTTITVSAKDNGGASGYHTAVNQTISVEVTAGYTVGAQVTALPSEDTLVFLIANEGTASARYVTSSINTTSTNDEDASVFYLSSDGALQQFDLDTDTRGKYVYNGGGNTTISAGNSAAYWASGMDNSTYPGLLQLSGGRFLAIDGNGVPKAYASSNLGSYDIIYAYLAVASTPTVTLSGDSVSGMKGDSNTSLTLTISNFTATGLNVTYKDDGESSFSASSDVATVTCGHSTGSNTVSVSFDGVGSTTVKLSVTRGSGDPIEKTFTVTVAAKPNLLRVVQSRAANPLVDITSIELQNGGSSRQFAKTNIYVEDTDENPIEIGTISDYVTLSRISGDDCISISGGEITGTSVGTAVVKFELKSLTSVYDTVTVSVIDDYKTTVNTITVINGAEVSQGETLEVSDHISTKTANTHFGSTTAIADNELLFSYTNSRAAGVIYSSFIFDVTDSTLDAGEFESRTIYVFASFDENYAGTSFTAAIEVAHRPVTGLIVDGVEKSNNDTVALSLPRNSSYDFNSHVTVNPANATESHDIIYTLTSGGSYVSLSNGVLSIGSKTGASVATITAKPYAKQDFSITFSLTITREAITITADLPEEWSVATSLSVGDRVAIVYESATVNTQLTGVSSNIGQVEDYETAGEPSSSYLFTVGAGSEADSFTFKKDNVYLAYTNTTTSKNNNLYTVSDLEATDAHDQASWTIDFSDFTITNVYNTNRNLRYNTQSPRFCGYVSGQEAPTIYKLAGGEAEVTVTDALFNIVNGAMSLKDGSSTLYDLGLCNASGSSFDVSAWNTLGSSFTSSIISDNKLAYARADENGNEIEQFLAVYDYVIGKKESGYSAYASANDFLGRVASGKITASPRVNPLNIVGTKTNTVAIIVIISMVSVTAIGGYFFLKKKKISNH